MNTPKPKLDISVREEENFFKRGRSIARKLDKGEPLGELTKNIWFEDPKDMMQFLTKNKFKILSVLRIEPHSVSDLVRVLKRDRSTIEKDLKVLETFGLVKCELKSNPGHGQMKMVRAANKEPVTLQIRI